MRTTTTVLLVMMLIASLIVAPVASAQSTETTPESDDSFQNIGESFEIMFVLGGIVLSVLTVIGFVWWLLKRR